jgi:hypothetical protein
VLCSAVNRSVEVCSYKETADCSMLNFGNRERLPQSRI